MTSAGPDEGRTTPDLRSWREFAIDGEFCVAEARLETQESLDQYTGKGIELWVSDGTTAGTVILVKRVSRVVPVASHLLHHVQTQ